MTIKIVTINILSDLSLWEERRDILRLGLAQLAPDVICIQEASVPGQTAQWLTQSLSLPHMHFSPKTGKEKQSEGLAILSRLPLLEPVTLDLRTQSRIAQIVQIQYGNEIVVVANAHLFSSPSDAPERVHQVERLMDWLRTLPGDPAVAICGDFNAPPDDGAIRRMKREYRSAYALRNGREPEYTAPSGLSVSKPGMLKSLMKDINLTGLRPNWRGTLDYIFISRKFRVIDCQLALNTPDPRNKRIYPSDHFGLMATLEV